MKKFDSKSRGHPANNRPNGPNNRRFSNNQGNGNGNNNGPSSGYRPQGKRVDAKNAQIWVNHTSKTLTSHLPLSKGNGEQRGGSWRPRNASGGQQGYGGQQGHGQDRNRFGQQRFDNGRNPNNRPDKYYYSKDNRQQNRPRPQVPSSAEDRIPSETAGSVPASAPVSTEPLKTVNGIDPFELFCAYHLGIGPNDTYRPSNINQVAQRFGVDPAAIRQATRDYGFDSEAMLNKEFDLALAQLDIQVAPEGISKVELAKGIYEEFRNSPILKRDWNKILAEDKKENERVFGS